jgi:mono/diheme cytochrome c family protein
VEYQALASLLDPNSDGTAGDDLAAFARERLKVIAADWEKANRAPPPTIPPELGDKGQPGQDASVRRGYELFTAAGGASCLSCHEDFGRKATYRYDIWGTVIRPANLTERERKGGDSSEAIVHRIRGGIGPSGMPAHGSLTDRQVWDVVRFVRSLPYPRELPPDVRQKVYPGSE